MAELSKLRNEIEHLETKRDNLKLEIEASQEQEHYRDRLREDYRMWEIDRKKLLEQIDEASDRLSELLEAESETKEHMAQLNAAGNKDVDCFKKQKEGFVNSLKEKEDELAKRELSFAKDKKKLATAVRAAEKEKSEYHKLLEKADVERKEARKLRVSAEKELKALDKKKNETDARLAFAEDYRRTAGQEEASLAKELADLRKEAVAVKSEWEIIKNTKEELEKERQAVSNDRSHLYSQQAAFKLAIEEFKRKGLKL
jgi:chromosome segregation ATPase